MPTQDSTASLRSVLFCPGHYVALYEPRFPYDQLDGVMELLDIADNYILNDVVALGAVEWHQSYDNDIRDFLLKEAERSTSVEIVSDKELDPYRRHLGVNVLGEEIRAFDKYVDEQMDLEEDPIEKGTKARDFGFQRDPMFEEVNTLEAQAYILFADSMSATYIPERRFGYKALEKYPNVLEKSPHFAREQFIEKLKERLSIIHARDRARKILTPSFLLEALRASQTQAGICSALRDLRYSSSAENYRRLTRTMIDESETEEKREKAFRELESQVKAALSQEKLQPRIPRIFKLTAALSAFAISTLFPLAAFLPTGVAIGESIDEWIRNRNNIFERYPPGSSDDLYDELKRLFPHIKFQAEHLTYFLEHRDFGWPDELDLVKFLYGENSADAK